jgi:tetratricopeptide (TPR) repeat protein
MHIPANAILAVTIMALVASYHRFASERYWHTLRLPLRCVVYPILAVTLVWLGAQSWRRTRECVGQARLQTITRAIAAESGKATPERLAALGKAQIATLEDIVVAEPKNFEAAIELGEALRIQSFVGLPGYESLAEKALVWFRRAMELNPYDARARIGYGMCLDWLGRTEEAGRYFEEARRLDGNQYMVAARVGWHLFQIHDYPAARQWFKKSLDLTSNAHVSSNAFNAKFYLRLTDEKLAEATNSPALNR